jgi:sec-independent protein translocase protein TatA
MNFFGMGTQEIVIILVAALVIFGPNRLPEIAGKIGKTVRDLRQMSSDLTSEFERTAGVQDLKKAVQGELTGVKSQVSSVTDSVKRDLNKAGSTVSSTVAAAKSTSGSKPATTSSSAAAAKSATTTAKSSTTAAKPAVPSPPKASKNDPLADVSFLEEITAPASNKGAAPATTSATNGAVSAAKDPRPASMPPTSADNLDALTRARQRRLAAGYNRRPE